MRSKPQANRRRIFSRNCSTSADKVGICRITFAMRANKSACWEYPFGPKTEAFGSAARAGGEVNLRKNQFQTRFWLKRHELIEGKQRILLNIHSDFAPFAIYLFCHLYIHKVWGEVLFYALKSIDFIGAGNYAKASISKNMCPV